MSGFEDPLFPKRVLTIQIIAGSMLTGVLLAVGLMVFLVYGQNNGHGMAPPADLPLISLIAVGMAVITFPLGLILPRIISRRAMQQIAVGTWTPPPNVDPASFSSDAAKLVAIRQSSMIIGLALLEGTGIFGAIAFLLEGQPFVLVVPSVAIVLMIVQFPTEGKMRAWVSEQLERLGAERDELR
jgi:hypothetical protein